MFNCCCIIGDAISAVCPGLSDPTDGAVSVPSYFVGGIASFICNPGYSLDGSQRRTCEMDQTWSGVQPTCDGK